MEHDNKTIDRDGFLLVNNSWKLRNFTGKVKNPQGTKEWIKNGATHRDDGPAIEWHDGDKWWIKNGIQHRDGGPAVENRDGSKIWYKNGLKHREDGPAVEWADGSVEWWYDGEEGLENFSPEAKKKVARNMIA